MNKPCKHVLCPICAANTAKQRRRALERIYRQSSPTETFDLLTINTPAEYLLEGRLRLLEGWRRLRRQKRFGEAYTAGVGHIEYPSLSGQVGWNIHAHLMMRRKEGSGGEDLSDSWEALMKGLGGKGRLDVQEGYGAGLPFYVTKRQRRELLSLSDAQLEEVVRDVPGKKWVVRYKRFV